MSSINDELEAIESYARGGRPTNAAPKGKSATRPAPGSGRGGAKASGGPRRGSSQFLPPGAGRGGAGRGQAQSAKNNGGAGGGGADSGDELLVDFPGSDDEMAESDDEKFTGAPPSMKPGGGGSYGAQNFSTGAAPPSFKMGGGPGPSGPRRGSGGMVMPPGHVPGAAGMNSSRYADDSDDSSEDYRGGGYGPSAGGAPPSYTTGGGGQPGYSAGGPPGGYGGSALPGNPMPASHQVQPQQPRPMGEAERLRFRQLQMKREASTKSGTKEHRPLVGGFAAAAYEAARADHFTPETKTGAAKSQRPRDLPSI